MKHPSLEQCILQMALMIALHPELPMPHKHIPTRHAQYQTKMDGLLFTQLPGLCYLLHMLSAPKLPENFTENQLGQLEDIVPGMSRNLNRIGCSGFEVSSIELLDLIADLQPSAEPNKQKTAAMGLRLLAANPCIAIQIAKLDGLPPLQLLVQTRISPANLQAAMAVSLIIASINERVTQCMRGCDELSLEMVIAAARLGDKQEQIAAAAVLERLASSEIYRRCILKLGGLDVLAHLLRSQSPTLRLAALKAIAETAQSQAAALKLSVLGIRPILMGVVEANLLTAAELAAELGAELEENHQAQDSLRLRWCAWSSALLALWRLAMAEHWQSSASTADAPFDLAAFTIFACATFFERAEAKTDPMRYHLLGQQIASSSSAPGRQHYPAITPSPGGDMAGSMSQGCQLLLQLLAAESPPPVRMAAVMWTAYLALQDRGQLREDEMWVPMLVQSQVDALSSEDWLGAKQRHGIQAARHILQDRVSVIDHASRIRMHFPCIGTLLMCWIMSMQSMAIKMKPSMHGLQSMAIVVLGACCEFTS